MATFGEVIGSLMSAVAQARASADLAGPLDRIAQQARQIRQLRERVERAPPAP